MKQTGELLRQARESAKLSLSEVALATKINPKILNAIEQGDSTNLPAKTFLKGFIRSYALYLKMDADDVIKTFNEETGNGPAPAIDKEVIRHHNEAAATKEEKPTKRRVNHEESFSGLRAIAVVVIVVLIGLIIGVRELIEKYQKETVVADNGEIKVSPLPQTAPPPIKKEEKKEEKKAEESQGEVAETEEAKEEEAKKEEAKAAEPESPQPATVAAEPPSLLRAPEPKPVEVKPSEPKPTEVAKPAEPEKPVEPPKPSAPTPAPVATAVLKAAKNEIILEALDKVEVKFQVHGQTKKLSLAPSQVHTIFADAPTTLDISDGGAVNIILNGRDKGPAGDLGKPKQIKIP